MTDPELASTERLRNLIKLTGDIDVDVVLNLKELLRRELRYDEDFKLEKVAEIYDTDTEAIPSFPAICIDITSAQTQQRTIGKERATFLRTVELDIKFYGADVNDKNATRIVRLGGSRISSVISRNADLNGYCRMGLRLGAVTYPDVVFGSKIIRAAVIPVVAPIMYRDRSAGPGARP